MAANFLPQQEPAVNKRFFLNLGKYLLAAGLLIWVVRSNWAPPPTKAVAVLGASTVGLAGSPAGCGPLTSVCAALPDRIEPRGLGFVWQRHVVQRQPIHLGFLVAGLALSATAIGITLIRWYLLVRALDLPLRLRDAMRFGLIGVFFNTFLPGSVGGDIIKAAALARGQTRRTAAVATVIMDRVIALWAMVWFVAILGGVFWLGGLVSGPAAATASVIVAFSWLIVAVSAGVWLLLGFLPDRRAERFAGRLKKLPVVGHTAAEFWRSAFLYRRRQKCVFVVMLLTCLGQVGFVLAFWCCASALWSSDLGPIPTLLDHFLLVPVGLVMQALVPTPGGAGGGEWGFAALFLLFGAAETNGVLASLVQRMITWVIGLVGYVLYLWMRPAAVAPAEELPTVLIGEIRPVPSESALAG
jgi:uncharacterized protein (TIRG00374 family)